MFSKIYRLSNQQSAEQSTGSQTVNWVPNSQLGLKQSTWTQTVNLDPNSQLGPDWRQLGSVEFRRRDLITNQQQKAQNSKNTPIHQVVKVEL